VANKIFRLIGMLIPHSMNPGRAANSESVTTEMVASLDGILSAGMQDDRMLKAHP
jgi:hypothetical protein